MRIANHKIDAEIRALAPFTNYNSTITAEIDARGVYRVVHWRTTILEYDTNASKILYLRADYISQTTSTLVGRILRALPRDAVESFLPYIATKHDFTRVRRMLRM
jgi:N12 class adenine-specific DNA methylase